jgi:cytochrome c oxidase assembly protein subunit 15
MIAPDRHFDSADLAARSNNHSAWPHHVGAVLVCLVFPLIWLGGLVSSYDAGMAVPDWPGTYGYNMFAYPLSSWFFGPWDLFVEHGHRLLATLSGMAAIALVVVTWLTDQRAYLRWLAIAILLMIILQGILGGVRVRFDDRTFAKLHGCLGPVCFALAVAFCVMTSRWWHRVEFQRPNFRASSIVMNRVAWSGLVLSYTQLVVGAFVRHIGVDASPGNFQILIYTHVAIAVVLLIGTYLHYLLVIRIKVCDRKVRSSIRWLVVLVTLQFCLGLATWIVKFGWPVWFDQWATAATFVIAEKSFWQMNVITLHVAMGSLILAMWTVHSIRCMRVFAITRRDNLTQKSGFARDARA